MSHDNGQHPIPAELLDARHILRVVPEPGERARRRVRRSGLVALGLFVLTVLSTLAVGTQFALTYAAGEPPFGRDFSPWAIYANILNHPGLLLAGLPFSFTLMAILLAHELGHFFACRYYGISASYPYFIPAPTIIGTMGAFIRIRSPIINRKALFDVGLAGPVVGFLFALPALAIAVASSKVVPGAQAAAAIQFGNPPLVRLLIAMLRPHVRPADLLLDPVGRAAWVGLFATALNLIPAGQLDGGHMVYALASEKHRQLSIAVALALVPLAYFWIGWLVWAMLLVLIGFRHPPLLDRWGPLDRRRLVWAAIGFVIFLLCFIPRPFVVHMP
jgi:membrane-associated protease RseP (regulator of RpoE activity)